MSMHVDLKSNYTSMSMHVDLKSNYTSMSMHVDLKSNYTSMSMHVDLKSNYQLPPILIALQPIDLIKLSSIRSIYLYQVNVTLHFYE